MKAFAVWLLGVVLVPVVALAQAPAADVNTITSVQVNGGTVSITGTKKPNFTTFTMTDPPRLVIDISEAVFSGVPEEVQVGNGTVTGIRTASYGSDASAIARVLIGYEREVETDIQANGNQLVVRVAGGGSPAVAQAEPAAPAVQPSAPAAQPTTEGTAAQAAAAAEADRQAQEKAAAQAAAAAEADRQAQEKAAAEAAARAQADADAEKKRQEEARAEAQKQEQARTQQAQAQAAEDQTRQEAEARAAAQAAADEKKRQEEEARASAARAEEERRAAAQAAADEKKRQEADARASAKSTAEERRAAAEAAQEERRAAAEAAAEERKAAAQAAADERRARQEAAAEERRQRAADAQASRTSKPRAVAQATPERERLEVSGSSGPVEVSSRRKTMTLVGFQQQSGASRVFVRTNEPVRYTVSEEGGAVVLELENTRIDLSNNTRPLDTSYFSSPVTRVEADASGRAVRVTIQRRQQGPYEARQDGNVIALDFQRAAR